jgi:uncharacterized membrane protein YeiH
MNASVISVGLYAVEVIGITAFALSGVIEAARRRMDAVGVTVVAGLAAFGGGTLRDLLLDRRPLFWVEHSELLWMVLLLSLAAILFLRGKHFALTERAMQLPDAVGLGLFCASGTQIALAMDLPALVCVVMGLFTGIIGGVLRDIVCNEIPRVFSDHRPYALCAFAGGWILIAADAAGLDQWLCLVLGITTTSVSRVAAIVLDWRIPQWKTEQ